MGGRGREGEGRRVMVETRNDVRERGLKKGRNKNRKRNIEEEETDK